MAEQTHVTFGSLLRLLRDEANLTQEELAEAAGLSPRSISDLERGINRTARQSTAHSLADALQLPEQSRSLFLAAARGRADAAGVLAGADRPVQGGFAAARRTLPRALVSFIGRESEFARLDSAAAGDPARGGVVGIHAIGGMAGIGKTAFAIQAAHRLAERFPDGQFFLPLHAHTPGQRPVLPADALASLLTTAGLATHRIPPGVEARAAQWRDYVAGKQILLVLDDAGGHEQVRPLLPGTPGSLVLITSRRRLTALDEASVLNLDTLPPAEAAMLLARLAGRPALASGGGPVDDIVRLCGCLPLAIGMLAPHLGHHPSWTPGDLAARLSAARDRLELMRAENLSVAAAFDLSYADLTSSQQRLFRRLGLVPGPDVDAYAVAALDGTSLETAWRNLDGLYGHYLLTEPTPGRYQMHDLVREHACTLAAAYDNGTETEDDAATERLLDYYLHAALSAGRNIPSYTAAQGRPPPGTTPPHLPDVSTRDRAVAWLEAERPNLHAAADYAAATARHVHAVQIPAAVGDFLRAHGDWDRALELHRTALAAARRASDHAGQALALRQLGIISWLTGRYGAAADHLGEAVKLYRAIGDQPGLAYALNHVGRVQELVGDYAGGLASRLQALEIARSVPDPLIEANVLGHLGGIHTAMGNEAAATECLQLSLDLYRDLGHQLGEADVLGVMGSLQRQIGDHQAAAANLQRALEIYREKDYRPYQPAYLNELGRTYSDAGDFGAALDCVTRALVQFRDLGSRGGEANALNGLGKLAGRAGDYDLARHHHSAALVIALEIGSPAEHALALEGLGEASIRAGNNEAGLAHLEQALAIYERTGDRAAKRIRDRLREERPTWPENTQPETRAAEQPASGSSGRHRRSVTGLARTKPGLPFRIRRG